MARIEAIEGGNNIRVSKGYKPSIEETKSKIKHGTVLREQLRGFNLSVWSIFYVPYDTDIHMDSVKPFKSKYRDDIDLDAQNPNLKKGCDRDF